MAISQTYILSICYFCVFSYNSYYWMVCKSQVINGIPVGCCPFLNWHFLRNQHRFRRLSFDSFAYSDLLLFLQLMKHNLSTSDSENKLGCHIHVDWSALHTSSMFKGPYRSTCRVLNLWLSTVGCWIIDEFVCYTLKLAYFSSKQICLQLRIKWHKILSFWLKSTWFSKK